MQNQHVFSIDDEFAEVKLGDKRLNQRLRSIACSLADHPSYSFPEASGSSSALAGTYRFLGNSKVTPEKILSPHVESTIKRASEAKGHILVAHDTTTLSFCGEVRTELGWITGARAGFLAHFSLAICRSDVVRPLGVLGVAPFFRTGKAKGRNANRNKRNCSENESMRWAAAMERSENLFPINVRPIHLADREADDYSLLSSLREQEMRFVIRIRQNRAGCRIPSKNKSAKLFDLLPKLEVVCHREVAISRRGRGEIPSRKKDHQPRGARLAKLCVTASPVIIPRSSFQHSDQPKSLQVNCVHVYEVDAPDGLEPVDWKLLTTESIETAEDILEVVDHYRARWVIEEYFKALKTGCAYEKRQLETKASLLNALALFAPIAWQLLMLRTYSRYPPNQPAKEILSKTQLEVLRAVSQKNLAEDSNLNQAMMAIAALGGHLVNNGPPGWQVLARGMNTLTTMEIAWLAARERCVES